MLVELKMNSLSGNSSTQRESSFNPTLTLICRFIINVQTFSSRPWCHVIITSVAPQSPLQECDYLCRTMTDNSLRSCSVSALICTLTAGTRTGFTFTLRPDKILTLQYFSYSCDMNGQSVSSPTGWTFVVCSLSFSAWHVVCLVATQRLLLCMLAVIFHQKSKYSH